MKNYTEFICAIILIVLGTVCGYMSNEIWQYIGAILITFIGFIIVFMECKNNKKINLIFKNVPGYRSGIKFNETIATVYYLFFMIALISILFLKLMNVGLSCIIMLINPYTLFSTVDSLHKKRVKVK